MLEFWKKQIELSAGTLKGNVISVLQGEDQLVLISELSLSRQGKAYTWRRANHYLFYHKRVIEAWLYESDQYSADEAFG